MRATGSTRIHARRLFHGRPRFDLVQVASDDEQQPWYGRLMGIFDVQRAGEWRTMVLVHWLTKIDDPANAHVPGASTFWQNAHVKPDVIDIASVECPVRMLTSVLDRAYFVRTKYNADL